jgi:hypothetical protein
MAHRIAKALAIASVLFAVAGTEAARADAIDGDWCYRDGRRLSIAGAQIVTPGGKRLTGNYSRHAFSYTAPANEPGAGATINMTLIDEGTVHLRQGAAAETQVWRRCQKPGS